MDVGKEYDTFEDFEADLKRYCEENNVQYTVTDSKYVQRENHKVKIKYDDKLKFRYISYQCKHGPKNKKKKVKGHGLRPNQRTFDIGCEAKLSASVDRSRRKLIIRQHVKTHNHDLSGELYDQYPEQRRRMTPAAQEQAVNMLKMGVKVKILQDYLKRVHQHFVTVKDLHNIRNSMKHSQPGNSEEERVLEELEHILSNDPEGSATIVTDNEDILEALLFMTGDMKKSFAKFPEVLFIDGTYCTNKFRLPLYTFLVEDGNGHGQPIAYAFVADERKSTITTLLTELHNIVNLQSVQVVIVDKDLKEIACIKSCMPNASVQICKFHVIQAMLREIKKTPVPEYMRKTLTCAFKQLVYAKTEASFNDKLAYLTRQATTEIMTYYHKNWHSIRELWAAHLTNKHTNLGNTTNNRTESHNDKIKDILSRNMTLSECIKGLILLQKSKSLASKHEGFNQNMKTPYRLGDDDITTNHILGLLTPYAANIVLEEIKCARMKTEEIAKETCNCLVKKTTLLPCRHTFAGRLQRKENLFYDTDAGERWHLSYQSNQPKPKTKRPREEPVCLINKKMKVSPKTREQKYNNAMIHFKDIADFLSQFGTQEYNQKLSTILELKKHWSDGKNATVVQLDEPESCSETKSTHTQSSQTQHGKEIKSTKLDFDKGNYESACNEPSLLANASSSTPQADKIVNEVDTSLTNLTSERESTDFKKLPNFRLPVTPPVRGQTRIKIKTKKGNKTERENVLIARRRVQNSKRNPIDQHSVTTLDQMLLDDLKDKNTELQDRHITVASNLLKKQFPQIQGLQDPVIGQKLMFRASKGDFVQILHNAAGHWLTVTNMNQDLEKLTSSSVFVYDSLYDTVTSWTKMQAATLVSTNEKVMKIHIKNFQKQSGGSDCGLFAIASATSICYGKDPAVITYDQKLMRSHLLECFESQELKPFPEINNTISSNTRGSTIRRSLTVPIYCICRLPDNGEERMIQCSTCSGWFHQTCLSVKKEVFKTPQLSNHWKCISCLSSAR